MKSTQRLPRHMYLFAVFDVDVALGLTRKLPLCSGNSEDLFESSFEEESIDSSELWGKVDCQNEVTSVSFKGMSFFTLWYIHRKGVCRSMVKSPRKKLW